jgi:putative tricarboxylic transport membrane protein
METAGGAVHPKPPVDKRQMAILVAMVAWTALYYAVFEKLGYLIATPIFLLGLLCHHHRGHHVTNLLVAFGFTAIVFLLFSRLLNVPLPTGPLDFLDF